MANKEATVKMANGAVKKTEKTPKKANKTKSKAADFGKDTVAWKDMTGGAKGKAVVLVFIRIILLLACLYFFICSLGLLEDSFQLLGGKAAGKTFQNNELLHNPVAGLMIGVLATVLVQSSSTSTSIVITMVGSGIIEIDVAIPIIMGANIGTSVTNTLVSFAQAADRHEFRLAFSGATVHDMFNWLTVLVLLPVEVASHYLRRLTGAIVSTMPSTNGTDSAPDMLKAITKPFTTLIVEVDKDIIENTAKAGRDNSTEDATGDVLKRYCEEEDVQKNVTHHISNTTLLNCDNYSGQSPFVYRLCQEVKSYPLLDSSNVSMTVSWDAVDFENVTVPTKRCDNLFAQSDLNDTSAGIILLVCSLLMLFLALYGIVKILHSLLHGSLAKIIRKTINADFPGKAACFTGYAAILVGCGLTMILQSSSVFTSTLTPLVGVGVVTVERMYPLTLGANIGTTLTGILAALSQSGEHIKSAFQVSLCHLFFNVTGIVLFYPLPFMRWPIGMAKTLGRTTSKHRWFAILYLIISFIVIPGAIFGLSVAGTVYLGAIGGSFLGIFLITLVINAMQRKRPKCLPRFLRNWNFLPLWMHSLKPVDTLVVKLCRCGCCQKLQEADLEETDDENMEIVVSTDEDARSDVAGTAPPGYTPSSTASNDSDIMTNGTTVREDRETMQRHGAHDNLAMDVEEHRM